MTRPHALVASLGLFTVVPVRPVAVVDRRVARGAMLAFPIVGLLVGVLGTAVAGVVAWLGSPLLGAVGGLAVLAATTGALHLDGVADTADGLGSRAPAEQALAIMRKSDIGPMGVVTLLFVLLADVAALHGLLGASPWAGAAALAWAAVVGRVAVVSAIASGAPGARDSGFGALFQGVVGRLAGGAWAAAALVGAGLLGWVVGDWRTAAGWVLASVAALGIAAMCRRYVVRRLSGLTGDTFGSLVECAQTAFLVGAALLATL